MIIHIGGIWEGRELEDQKKMKKLKSPGGCLHIYRRQHKAAPWHYKGGLLGACVCLHMHECVCIVCMISVRTEEDVREGVWTDGVINYITGNRACGFRL